MDSQNGIVNCGGDGKDTNSAVSFSPPCVNGEIGERGTADPPPMRNPHHSELKASFPRPSVTNPMGGYRLQELPFDPVMTAECLVFLSVYFELSICSHNQVSCDLVVFRGHACLTYKGIVSRKLVLMVSR